MNRQMMSFSIPSPCKDCKDRHAGCHSECGRYSDYSIEVAKARQERFDTMYKQNSCDLGWNFTKRR